MKLDPKMSWKEWQRAVIKEEYVHGDRRENQGNHRKDKATG